MNIQTCFLFFMLAAAAAQAQPDTVVIGTQTWMTKNLDTDKFSNGDPIPQAKTPAEWAAANKNKKPAWCYYNNDPKMGATHGKLYNFFALTDARGIVPKGWHVPTRNDWSTLDNSQDDFMKTGGQLKSTSGWIENGNGTNSLAFNGTPGGVRSLDGEFSGLGKFGHFWSGTTSIENVAFIRYLDYRDALFRETRNYMGDGVSVRLVSDRVIEKEKKPVVYKPPTKNDYEAARKPIKSGAPCDGKPTVTDIDGNVYNTVQLGKQCWMKENLKTTRYADGTELMDGKKVAVTADNKNKYWFVYADSLKFKEKYGLLYNWYAVSNGAEPNDNKIGIQGICPKGWHVPSHFEWMALTDYKNGHADDLPYDIGGSKYGTGTFGGMARDGAWWSTTPSSFENEVYFESRDWNDNYFAPRARGSKVMGVSVKCVCDE